MARSPETEDPPGTSVRRTPDATRRTDPPAGIEYRIADAYEALRSEPESSAQFIYLDDAWARPKRGNNFGVTYETHPFSWDDSRIKDGQLDPEWVTTDLLHECERVLAPGGVLLAATDAWLLANIMSFLSEWGSETAPVDEKWHPGGVTETTHESPREVFARDDHPDHAPPFRPDTSTSGEYLSNGGYSVVALFTGQKTDHYDYEAVDSVMHQVAKRQRNNFEWGTAKPLSPHLNWLEFFTDPGDRVLVPCAGTAPTALAAEALHGDNADVLAIDVEDDARTAYLRRRAEELNAPVSAEQFTANPASERRDDDQQGLESFKATGGE